MHQPVNIGVLPFETMRQILWSNHLDLFDKLRCQEVCKPWRRLLQAVPSGPQRATLTEELAVKIATAHGDSQNHAALRLEAGIPTIHLDSTTPADPSPSYTACWQWLSLKAGFFAKIKLTGQHPQAWQLQAFLELFQTACTPPAAEVKLVAGTFLWSKQQAS